MIRPTGRQLVGQGWLQTEEGGKEVKKKNQNEWQYLRQLVGYMGEEGTHCRRKGVGGEEEYRERGIKRMKNIPSPKVSFPRNVSVVYKSCRILLQTRRGMAA